MAFAWFHPCLFAVPFYSVQDSILDKIDGKFVPPSPPNYVVEAWDLKRDVTNEKGLERVRFAFGFSFLLSCCDIGQIIFVCMSQFDVPVERNPVLRRNLHPSDITGVKYKNCTSDYRFSQLS